jgi:hypothetical protein
MNIAIIHVKYDEPDSATYKGVEVHIGQKNQKFTSGKPTVDYNDAVKWSRDTAKCEHIYHSSSVDNFIIDGGKIRGL